MWSIKKGGKKMKLKKENLKMIFEFDNKEEQEYWEERFIDLSVEIDEIFKTSLMPLEEAKRLKNIESKYNIAKDGIDKLMTLIIHKEG